MKNLKRLRGNLDSRAKINGLIPGGGSGQILVLN
jgi:hypothetical protein